MVGSTDMGNVSYLVPSIHPMIEVAPAGVPIHTPEFAGYAVGRGGDRAVLDGAKAMAMTVADLWAGDGPARRRPGRASGRHRRRDAARSDVRDPRRWSGAIPRDRGGAALA